jgi:predicted O-methyltransferase YrrM
MARLARLARRGASAAKASRDAALTMAFGGTAFGVLSWLDRPAVGIAVLVVCASIAIALHASHVGRRIERAIDQQAERLAIDAERAGVELVKRIAANAQGMATLTTRFPELRAVSLSTSAMEPANLGILLQLLDELGPRRIVELGCGVSTHLITAWIRATGGPPLLSFDDSERWAGECRVSLERLGLLPHARLEVAPLRGRADDRPWYDLDEHVGALTGIDLLVVDGPPAYEDGLARLPAFGYFRDRLSPNGVIFLDDGLRPGEQEVVARWSRTDPGLASTLYRTASGCWVLRRPGAA